MCEWIGKHVCVCEWMFDDVGVTMFKSSMFMSESVDFRVRDHVLGVSE